jgi:hypothetical protein
VTFNHCTPAQLRQLVRARYRTAQAEEAVRIGAWIAGNLSLAQIQVLFGVSSAQAQAIQARCQGIASQLAALRATAGE